MPGLSASPSHRPSRRRSRALATLALVMLVSLSSSSGAATGLTDDGSIDDVEQAMAEQLDASGVPGGAFVVVTADGEISARGVGNAGDAGEVTARTPFVIGSTTKSFTALAVMQLVDDGAVALDDAVRDYVPELSLAAGEPVEDITVRHLLQHTSGLSDAVGGAMLASSRDGTALDAVRELDGAELVGRPGDSWLYANANYVLAGLVVERASGLSYPEYVDTRIFAPLGMDSSYVSVDAADGLTDGHQFWFGVPVGSRPTHREGVMAAGYLISCAADMGRYLAMYLQDGISVDGTRVVSPAGLETMLSPGPEAHMGPWAEGAQARYAMGWMVGGPWAEDALVHPGNSPDSSAMITLFPARGLAVATLLNAGHEIMLPGNPTATDRISRNIVHVALGEPALAAPSLRGFYAVFDLVSFLLVAFAAWGVARSWARLRHPRPHRTLAPLAGGVLTGVAAGLLFLAPSLVAGWPVVWTWAPDLAVVLATLVVLLAVKAILQVASLVRPARPSYEDGGDADLRAAVEHAVRAPSGHNTQPWSFEAAGDELRLRRDLSRSLPVVDPEDRELTISCGAALGHLRLALRHVGYDAAVHVLPDPLDEDLVAATRLGRESAPAEDELFDAIAARRTVRGDYAHQPVTADVLTELRREAAAEGVDLRLVEVGDKRTRLADLVAEGDRVQFSDRGFRRELAAWLHANHSRRDDGMPGAVHGVGDLRSLVGGFVIRWFDVGRGQAATDHRLVLDAPVVAVLTTSFDAPRDWIATGQALSRVLLRATARGLSASFFNQPVELEQLRPQVSELLGVQGHPQLILRFGYAASGPATPRRAVDEVFTIAAPPMGAELSLAERTASASA